MEQPINWHWIEAALTQIVSRQNSMAISMGRIADALEGLLADPDDAEEYDGDGVDAY